MPKNKMYVLVRKELDQTYRNVQGTHAVVKFALDHSTQTQMWNNEYLIFLGVRFQTGIEEWKIKLTKMGIPFSVFFEPDIEQETAIACIADSSVFKELQLA